MIVNLKDVVHLWQLDFHVFLSFKDTYKPEGLKIVSYMFIYELFYIL